MFRSKPLIHWLVLLLAVTFPAKSLSGQVVTVCDVFRNPWSFDGRRVAIYGEYESGMHRAGLKADVCNEAQETDGVQWPLSISFLPLHTKDIDLEDYLEKDTRSLDFFGELLTLLLNKYEPSWESSRYGAGNKEYLIWGTFVGVLHVPARGKYKPTGRSDLSVAEFSGGFGDMGREPMYLRVLAIKDIKITGLSSPVFDVQKVPER